MSYAAKRENGKRQGALPFFISFFYALMPGSILVEWLVYLWIIRYNMRKERLEMAMRPLVGSEFNDHSSEFEE
ncbi:hypothetical protein C0033_04090 [Clostridium sp. chh4-2]|uniref:hypothetical protein n=1 Tax=Clostridium sp. chh4-2 TaxID=2067550 RepID=UPI000CCEC019|nr:hypothetical protein [Clostridium sp. chh4-2]PNV63272.1 hypothetical protein C0033_04090 [Clostridium sp. chh4-2]